MVTAKEDDKAAYLLLGIENQSDIHYAMPVRNMLYDALQYASQVNSAGKSHRKGNNKPESSAEYLSGFYKSDRILPVITLTRYFGADEWTAPRNLYQMLDADERILKYIILAAVAKLTIDFEIKFRKTRKESAGLLSQVKGD